MERLTDEFIEKDLEWVFVEAQDFTRETKIKIGAEEFVLMASLQSSDMEFSASETPVNAYRLELILRIKDISATAKKHLSNDAIIYIDGVAYKIIDADICRRVVALSLERGTKRGKGLVGRDL